MRSRNWSVMASTTRGVMKPLFLITDVSTQCNSKFYQRSFFLQLRLVVQFKCEEEPALYKYFLTDPEWIIIKNIVVFLKPFVVATKLVSGSSHPTFASETLTYRWLIEQVKMISFFGLIFFISFFLFLISLLASFSIL